MRNRRAGITLTELVIAVALTSICSLMMAGLNRTLVREGTSTKNKQIMQGDARIILNQVGARIRKAGDSVSAGPVATGNTIIALPDNAILNVSPEIIFFIKDQDANGVMSANDLWVRYSTGVYKSRLTIMERKYRAANWLAIKNGTAALVETNYIKIQDGVNIRGLDFTLYDSSNPPLVANQDPQSASAVRMAIRLERGSDKYHYEQVFTLENILYGPH